MPRRKGCWTCTARRIRCDGGQPTCENCARAQRDCLGYSQRLSWPRADDKKRFVVGEEPAVGARRWRQTSQDLLFINTTWHDMEGHMRLTLRMQPSPLVQYVAEPRKGAQSRVPHADLLSYFCDSAYLSLVTFGDTPAPQLRDSLLRMALAPETPEGLALYHALLAFSSLCRQGDQQQSMELNLSALHILSEATKAGRPPAAAQAAQLVAASMLLGAVEMQRESSTSGAWLWHVWGAVDVVRASDLAGRPQGSDTDDLLGWVFLHDTVSHFAMRHWRHRSLAANAPAVTAGGGGGGGPPIPPYPPLTRYRPVTHCPDPAYATLNLLTETCSTLLDPRDPASRDPAYRARIAALDARIEAAASRTSPGESDQVVGAELYRIATRVYLARSSSSSSHGAWDIDAILDDDFIGEKVLRSCDVCRHFFPLFILAGEARSDEHRAAMLRLMERTEGAGGAGARRAIAWFRDAVRAVWAQHDLHADGDLLVDYAGVMSAVVSSSGTIPSFA